MCVLQRSVKNWISHMGLIKYVFLNRERCKRKKNLFIKICNLSQICSTNCITAQSVAEIDVIIHEKFSSPQKSNFTSCMFSWKPCAMRRIVDFQNFLFLELSIWTKLILYYFKCLHQKTKTKLSELKIHCFPPINTHAPVKHFQYQQVYKVA